MKLKDIYKALKEGNSDNDLFYGDIAGGVLLICTQTGNLLASLRSSKANEPNTWGIIGGAIDRKETIKNGVEREFREETGFTGHMKLYKAFVYKTSGFSYHNFIGETKKEFKPKKNWETKKFEWMSLENLQNIQPKHFGLRLLLSDSKSIDIIKRLAGVT